VRDAGCANRTAAPPHHRTTAPPHLALVPIVQIVGG
jgi:hypothetical protein